MSKNYFHGGTSTYQNVHRPENGDNRARDAATTELVSRQFICEQLSQRVKQEYLWTTAASGATDENSNGK
jgi:hypothetical protein